MSTRAWAIGVTYTPYAYFGQNTLTNCYAHLYRDRDASYTMVYIMILNVLVIVAITESVNDHAHLGATLNHRLTLGDFRMRARTTHVRPENSILNSAFHTISILPDSFNQF